MLNSNPFIAKILSAFRKNPLFFILLFGFCIRLIAVIFSRGYMMHDDHFLTIEPSGSWAAGKNFNQWLPGIGNDNPHPEPISFFYLGWLYLLFKIFHFIGIENPESQMYLIRFIHAVYSLLVIYYGYKITELLSDKKNAIRVGLLLAFIAIMPNFSVRNLVEMVCIPPLLIGFYLLIKNISFRRLNLFGHSIDTSTAPAVSSKNQIKFIALAAVLMGMAVGIRYQTGLLVALTGLVIFIFHSFRFAFIFGIISFAVFFLTQADDILLWGGEPFQHLRGYFEYNNKNSGNYPGSPIAYLSLISIFILPPVSLFLLAGFLRSWHKQLLIFLPIAGFLLFHILYPNRQERFILPALPFVVILGVIGWNSLITTSVFWQKKSKLIRASWVFFWVLNISAMMVLSFTYSKKSRVEAMNYIYDQGDCRNFALEFTYSETGAMMPQFYCGVWTGYYYWKKGDDPLDYIKNMKHDEEMTKGDIQPRREANYYLFYDDTDLEARVDYIKAYYPDLTYQTTIESGWFDKLLHYLNPKNTLEKIHIYKIPSLSNQTNNELETYH